jgi:hypothetical protein
LLGPQLVLKLTLEAGLVSAFEILTRPVRRRPMQDLDSATRALP